MFDKKRYTSRKPKPLRFVLMALAFLAIASALSWLIMILWNNILTDVASFKPLNFWKAAGLLVLAKILFGGLRRGRPSGTRYSKHKEWRDKWMHMSREERLEAKARWKEHCKHRNIHKGEEE